MQNPKIGILGGSFNPAHGGHVYISLQAINLLGLDEVWWLVAKQNPLKQEFGMASFAKRFAFAEEITAEYKKIKISNFEKTHNTTYTYDTLVALKQTYPENNFVWLMGADNLLQFPKWYKWREIMNIFPIAIFNRLGFSEESLLGQVAIEFSGNKLNNPAKLAGCKAPAWSFLDIEPNLLSSTEIRNK